jgi:ElaB/YqjD/DUF883 family membrane-anchored ribosome-binding protein
MMAARSSSEGLQGRADRLAEDTGEAIRQIGSKVESKLQDAAATMARAQEAITDQAQTAAGAADEYVHENPWRAIGIAAAAGLLVGILLSRR